jgi:hypothetical protein
VRVFPPAGFTPTDFEVISVVNTTSGAELGGYSIIDPPGVSPQQLDIRTATRRRLYTFALIGERSFGPFVSVVPIAFSGFDANGIPRLFAAKMDRKTGLPQTIVGPGRCFVPTRTRINSAKTGELLPKFRFRGRTQVTTTVVFLEDHERRR